MDQIQRSYRAYPGSVSSCTFSLYLFGRANKDVGNYDNLITVSGQSALTTLAIVYPTGYNMSVPVADIQEACVQHLLNGGIEKWYSPPNGKTARTAIMDALNASGGPFTTGSTSIALFFNGQNGPVLAS